MHHGRLDGCYHGGGCWLHPASIFLTMSIRIFTRISSPLSTIISLLRQAGLPLHCRRRLLHSLGVCKTSYSYLPHFYILILLGGDIQPNPGPLFPPHRRYSNAKSIIAGVWNERTLLEKKGLHTRPTAIVAHLRCQLAILEVDVCFASHFLFFYVFCFLLCYLFPCSVLFPLIFSQYFVPFTWIFFPSSFHLPSAYFGVRHP